MSTVQRARTRKDLAEKGARAMRREGKASELGRVGGEPGVLPVGTTEHAMRLLYPEPAPYGNDPVGWVRDRCGGFVWSKQEDILHSVRDNKYTAVKACHGPGKSASAGMAAGWWIDVHDLGTAFVVTTAPTWPQVQAILWREIRRLHGKAQLPGRITQECHWYMGDGRGGPQELIAMGRKPADYDEQAFQGIHARYILVIIDEACGVPVALWNSVLSLATNENARVLAIGNPDDPSSYFADVCKPGSGWNVITISAYDTPNFTGEEIPDWLAQDLVHPDWVEERSRDWGPDSPIFQSKILGEFPDISDEYLITPTMLERAYATHHAGLELGRYGCDIARMGSDKTVIYRNRGNVIRFEESWGQADTMKTAGRLLMKIRRHYPNVVPAIIDSIGIGAGVFDRLREQGQDVVPFAGSERAYKPDKFKNRRAEIYWGFRQGLEDGLYDLDPNDLNLASELTSIRYWVDSSGRIVVESKEDMRQRGIKSPDHADAAVYSTVRSPMMVDPRARVGETLTGDLLQRAM